MYEKSEKTCFIIMSFDQKYDSVYEQAIKRAVQDKGYKCIRLDDESIPNTIPNKMIREIINSDLVIADISDPNPNVFYELGISHSVGNKTIIISQNLKNLPFDVRTEYTIGYKDTRERLRLLYYQLKDIIDKLSKHPNEPSNIVQLAGRDYFDLRNEIRNNLKIIIDEGKRIKEFRVYLAHQKVDNTDVVKELAQFIVKNRDTMKKINFVSISGAAGLGKTTLAEEIKSELVTNCNVLKIDIIQSDAYMLDRAERLEQNLSGYDPKASNISELRNDLQKLKDNQIIFYKPYNHTTGEHDDEIKVEPSDIIIIDGIHSFHPLIIPMLDFKLFIYASPSDAKELRFLADIKERNYTVHTAFQHADNEFYSFEKHILHYIKFADKVVQLDNYWKYHV